LNNLELFNAEKSEMIEINKKIDNLEREITNIKRNKNYNINNYNNNNNYNISLKRAISGEKSFSFAEKSIIKANINKLTLEQKKGIVNVLGDVLNTTNKKIVEFDIEKLGNKKLRELEKYVLDCLQKNMEKKAQNINNLIQIKNDQNNNSILNSSHNQSEIDTNKKLDIENDNFSNTSDDDDESESSSLSSLK
jgi:DNA-directed RNA polymerase beta subunit